jgi:hypothetical protein
MSYRLTYNEHPSYLHAKADGGTHDEKTVRKVLLEVHETCVKRNCSAVLIEMALSGPSLDATAIFSVVARQSELAKRLRKIAYVDASRERNPERMKFAETVAANRGVNVKLFRDLEDAHRWMREAPAKNENQEKDRP